MQNLLLEVIFLVVFSKGEGLAIAVAIEDNEYPIEELVFDLVNLRAGHQFRSFNQSESRLSVVCRAAFGFRDCPGYLKGGLPLEYGEGQRILYEMKALFKNLILRRMK